MSILVFLAFPLVSHLNVQILEKNEKRLSNTTVPTSITIDTKLLKLSSITQSRLICELQQVDFVYFVFVV